MPCHGKLSELKYTIKLQSGLPPLNERSLVQVN